MQITELLRRVGLGKNEADMYLALLETGPATISDISKRTGLHRPIVYKHLPVLQEQGLVTVSRKGERNLFVAEPPDRLERLLDDVRGQLQIVLPGLTESFHARGKRPTVKTLEGKKGIKFVFEDLVRTLRRGDTFYRYSSASKSREEYLPSTYRAARDAKQLERFVITSQARASEKGPRMERAIKVFPKEYGLFDFDVTQVVYGNKVAFIDYGTETATIIENPVFAAYQTALFRALYDRL